MEAEGEGFSKEGSEEHNTEELAGADPSGAGTHHAAEGEAQEENEAEEAEQPKEEEERLTLGPQALRQYPYRLPRKWTRQGKAAPASSTVTKMARKIASKTDKSEVVHSQSTRLSEATTPPAKRQAIIGVNLRPQLSPASSHSSTVP